MDFEQHQTVAVSQRQSAVWPGLLLGSLLMLFVAAFVYVAYLFLSWGQDAAAQAPNMPPLALPKLVRAASSTDTQEAAAPLALLRSNQGSSQTAGPKLTGRVTVLVTGVDARPGQKIARTDSIMLLTIDPETGTAGMLSLPRDMLVSVSGVSDTVKINTVNVIGEVRQSPGGGPALLRETVSDLTGYPIDYYVGVNFEGFRQIIDLVGGIDIDVEREIRDDQFPNDSYGFDPLYIPAGRQHMDGALALKYARVRHIDTDYQRASRQQQVLLALKDKLMQPGQLAALLPRLPGLAMAMANSVQTDMPVEKGIRLARALGEVELKDPTRVVIDSSYGVVSLDPNKGYILTPDLNKLRAASAAVFAQPAAGPSEQERALEAAQAEGARLVVLNGTAQEGLAAKKAADLSNEGLNIVAVGNAEKANYEQTLLITHGDSAPATVEMLAQQLGISPDRIRSDPPSESVDLTLIIGADQAAISAIP